MKEDEDISRHNLEIQENLCHWQAKPLLREIYRGFHEVIARYLAVNVTGLTVELGSGIGNIKEVIPGCLRTDLFPNPWLDRTENAYQLSFGNQSVSNLILFDVFHHLRYPGTAFRELIRVLAPGGRVIIFDPCLSALGLLVYGLLHFEPILVTKPIEWDAPANWDPNGQDYYAAQGNATRVFYGRRFRHRLGDWNLVVRRSISSISYVLSGGYSRPQMYPDAALPWLRRLDRLCGHLPFLFATRLLVVLEKKPSEAA